MNKITISKSVLFCLTLFVFLTTINFTFNDLDDAGFYGKITYDPNGARSQYTLLYFSQTKPKNKVREETYDAKGNIISYIIIQYDKQKRIDTEYNQHNNIVKTTTNYYNENGRVKKKIIKLPNKEQDLQIIFDYGFYDGKELYQTERYFYGDDLGDNYYHLKRKLVYTHKNQYEKWVQYFIKYPNHYSGQYTLHSVKIYKYNDNGNINTLVCLDNNHQLQKYFQLYYGNDKKLTKIASYFVKEKSTIWTEHLDPDLNPKKLILSSYIVFYQKSDLDKFSQLKKISAPNTKKQKDKMIDRLDQIDSKITNIEKKVSKLEKDVKKLSPVLKDEEEDTEEEDTEEEDTEDEDAEDEKEEDTEKENTEDKDTEKKDEKDSNTKENTKEKKELTDKKTDKNKVKED